MYPVPIIPKKTIGNYRKLSETIGNYRKLSDSTTALGALSLTLVFSCRTTAKKSNTEDS